MYFLTKKHRLLSWMSSGALCPLPRHWMPVVSFDRNFATICYLQYQYCYVYCAGLYPASPHPTCLTLTALSASHHAPLVLCSAMSRRVLSMRVLCSALLISQRSNDYFQCREIFVIFPNLQAERYIMKKIFAYVKKK